MVLEVYVQKCITHEDKDLCLSSFLSSSSLPLFAFVKPPLSYDYLHVNALIGREQFVCSFSPSFLFFGIQLTNHTDLLWILVQHGLNCVSIFLAYSLCQGKTLLQFH